MEAGIVEDATPLAVIASWARANSSGVNVDEILQSKVDLLGLEAVRKNLKSTIRGARAWHLFATGALGIPECRTLPPARRCIYFYFL